MSAGDELAGRLRERVTILRQAGDRDALAGAEGAWMPIGSRWAAVVADGSGEAVVGESPSAAAKFRVTIRAGLAVLPADRIDWMTRRLTVRAAIADPTLPERIVLMAEEMR